MSKRCSHASCFIGRSCSGNLTMTYLNYARNVISEKMHLKTSFFKVEFSQAYLIAISENCDLLPGIEWSGIAHDWGLF